MYLEFSARGLMTAFFRQKMSFLLVFLLVMIGGIYYLASLRPAYESTGTFIIKFGQGAVPALARPDGQGPAEYSRSDRDEVIQSNVQILQSADLLKSVIEKIGVERLYPGITLAIRGTDSSELAAVARLREKDLKVTTDSRSDLIEVRVRNASPYMAKEFAETLLNMFIVRQSQIYGLPQTSFLDQQIADAKRKIVESQSEFQDFKQKNGISTIDGEMTSLISERSELAVRAFQAGTEAQANAVREAQESLSKLENDAVSTRATYRSDSPIVTRLDAGIATARAQLAARQAELNAVGGKGGALEPKIGVINARIALLEENRSRYNELQQRVTMDEESYKYYQQRGEEARVNDRLNQENITRISVVDKPTQPVKPVGLNRLLLLAAILTTACLLAIAVAFVLEFLNDTIVFPEQLKSCIGLPVLGGFEPIKGA